ncbi:MAG: ATP-binding protein, partial [Lachnospiraceae bacterium]|nr:ATP-binding protein [Lachnospiraceae bacterium]
MKRLAALGAMRISYAVKGRIEDELYDKYSEFLTKDVSIEDIEEAEKLAFAEDTDDSEAYARVNRLVQIVGTDPVVLSMTELMALCTLVPLASEIIGMISGGQKEGVNLLSAARAAGFFGKTDEILGQCKRSLELVKFLYREIGDQRQPFYLIPYRMDDWLLGFLSGDDSLDVAFSEFADTLDPYYGMPDIFGMEDEIETLTAQIDILGIQAEEEGTPLCVIISGETGSGRYTAVSAVAETLEIRLLSIDFEYLMGTAEPKDVMRRLVRTCLLDERSLVVRNITKFKDTVFMIDRLEKIYSQYCVLPLFLLPVPEVKLIPAVRFRYVAMSIPKGSEAALKLWRGLLPDKYKDMAVSLASKMTLTAGQVKRVTEGIETAESIGQTIDTRLICKLCYEVLDDGRYDNIKRVEPGFTLDDLKIDDRNRNVLLDVVRQVELRQKVFDDWGLKKRYAYGRCVSVILAGPPGTGKTMTVHALAGQLGLELYKVDLSQIVDKYVGETEKRLEEVFAKAQKSNMILFFDEADAVMSKRSEVKDSKDKYANTEVSFILQRIEEYDGIVLLATNNLQNIDTAFMRRIRYVVNFNLPDKETRKGIWQGAFGKSVPLS